MIYIYSFFSLFCFFCLLFKKIKFNNPMPWLFFFFINLYTLSTYFAHKGFFISRNNNLMNLLGNAEIINIYLLTSSISLITYSVILLSSSIYNMKGQLKLLRKKWDHFILIVIIFPFAFYVNSLTNWTYEQVGLLPSLAAYFRNAMTFMALVILITDNYSKRVKYIAVVLCAIVTFISTQRTNFFIVIIGILIIEKNNIKALVQISIAIFFILAVGSIRNGVSILRIMYPILGEGVFGSWGMLNAIDHYLRNGYNIYNVLKPLNPAINWIIPGLELSVMSDGIKNYYPMGGFFFLSDAYLFNPILGPILYTVIFHNIYSWSYVKMMKSKTKNIDFFLIQCLLFLYIKANIKTITAMFVFFFLILFLYNIFESLLLIGTKDIRNYENKK